MREHVLDSRESDHRDISIEVSSDKRLILVKLRDSPQSDAIVGMLVELDRLIAADASLRVLIDESDLRPSLFGPGDIGRFAGAWRRSTALRSSHISVFVSNLAMYGLNRMFQGLANADGHVGVFQSRADALAWLNAVVATPDQRRSGGR
jgi:hypothetical protein